MDEFQFSDEDIQDDLLAQVYFSKPTLVEPLDSESDTPSDISDDQGHKRYFVDTSKTCFTCGKKGHVLRDCPEALLHPCNLCGQIGHERIDCPKEICFNCFRAGHQSKECRNQKRRYNEWCSRCKLPGHLPSDCPLEWRQYVFKEYVGPEKFDTDVKKLYLQCYNCAQTGHFGDDCNSRRRNDFSIFHDPFYDFATQSTLKVRRKTELPFSDQVPSRLQSGRIDPEKLTESNIPKFSEEESVSKKKTQKNRKKKKAKAKKFKGGYRKPSP